MDEKTNWRAVLLEDGLIITVLMVVGLTIAVFKMAPPLMRWAKGMQ